MKFDVRGIPAPQGSKRAFVVNGRAVMTEASATTQKAWRQAVTGAAMEARGYVFADTTTRLPNPTILLPVTVCIDFVFPRPKSARKTQVWKSTKPDVDKLVRSTLDGLTDAGVFADDALVVELHATKRLCRLDGTDAPGASISVEVKEL